MIGGASDFEYALVAAFVPVALAVLSVWKYYVGHVRAAHSKVEDFSRQITIKKKGLRREFLKMMAKETDYNGIGRVLNLCYIPLTNMELKASELRAGHSETSVIIKITAFTILGFFAVVEAFAVAYIALIQGYSLLEFAFIFVLLSLLFLVIIVLYFSHKEWATERKVKEMELLLSLLEESARKGECVEEIEELLEES